MKWPPVILSLRFSFPTASSPPSLFLEGLTACRIAKELTARHILTVTGKEKWTAATINGVRANEKYTGCAKIQKTWCNLNPFPGKLTKSQ